MAARVAVRHPVIFSGVHSGGEGIVTDLSTDGVRITAARPILTGASLWLHICLHTPNRSLLADHHEAIEIASAVARW